MRLSRVSDVVTWRLQAWADDVIKEDAAVGAAVELSLVHGRCQDARHPGKVSAKVGKLLVWWCPLQVEAGHRVWWKQTLEVQWQRSQGEEAVTWDVGSLLLGQQDIVQSNRLKLSHCGPTCTIERYLISRGETATAARGYQFTDLCQNHRQHYIILYIVITIILVLILTIWLRKTEEQTSQWMLAVLWDIAIS